MREIDKEEFFINNETEEKKEYNYFFCDGTSISCDFDEELKLKCYAYSMYSSKTNRTKYFVKTEKGVILDPNTNIKNHKNKCLIKSVNKTCFDLYVMYLDPKKRSRFRLVEAQKNI